MSNDSLGPFAGVPDHIIVFGERSLDRALAVVADDKVVEIREVGGLHHHYERRAG